MTSLRCRSFIRQTALCLIAFAGISDVVLASHGHNRAPSETPVPEFTTKTTLISEFNASQEGQVRVFLADGNGEPTRVDKVGMVNRNTLQTEVTNLFCMHIRTRVILRHATIMNAPQSYGLKGFVVGIPSCLFPSLPPVDIGFYHHSDHNGDTDAFGDRGMDVTGPHLRWRVRDRPGDSWTVHVANYNGGTVPAVFVTSKKPVVARGEIPPAKWTVGSESETTFGPFMLTTNVLALWDKDGPSALRGYAALTQWENTHFAWGGFVDRRQNLRGIDVAGAGEWLFGLRTDIGL